MSSIDEAVELSLVVPVYNEERSIELFVAAALPILRELTPRHEIVFVNDGSTDRSSEILARQCDTGGGVIRVVELARNFGKDVALSAGLAYASGAAVVPVDCDLQHPLDLIRDMYREWKNGSTMVVAIRARRPEEGALRRASSHVFYRVLRALTSVDIPPNAGDYRLLDRQVVDVLNSMPERTRFMKGLFAWPGFKHTEVYFEAAPRETGRSSWSYWKLWNFALDGIFSFSSAPLRVWTYVGVVTAAGSLGYFVWTVIKTLVLGVSVPGYASLLSLLLLFNGLSLISNGIQGEYIARVFEEVKNRPLYVVSTIQGFAGHPIPAAGSHRPPESRAAQRRTEEVGKGS